MTTTNVQRLQKLCDTANRRFDKGLNDDDQVSKIFEFADSVKDAKVVLKGDYYHAEAVKVEPSQKPLTEINTLKKGDYFKLSETAKSVYVYDGYNRMTRKYSAHRFDDISAFREWKKGKLVFTDFEF